MSNKVVSKENKTAIEKNYIQKHVFQGGFKGEIISDLVISQKLILYKKDTTIFFPQKIQLPGTQAKFQICWRAEAKDVRHPFTLSYNWTNSILSSFCQTTLAPISELIWLLAVHFNSASVVYQTALVWYLLYAGDSQSLTSDL